MEIKMSSEVVGEEFRPVNLVEQIANFVEQAILNGSFKMGYQLVEQEISRRFKTSRQPIREAFRVLEKRGLVTVVPRKGTYVATITWEDFEQFFPVIATLDGLAGKMVYVTANEETLRALDASIESLVKNAAEADTRKYLVSHAAFHSVLNKATRNNLLIDTLSSIRTAHSWFIMTHMNYSEEQYKRSIWYHRKIVEELRGKSIGEEGMEKLMREHVLNSVDFYRSYFGKS
jgi:DNA-binding GntR family transcriptional regulator